jgi:hypothetical protein
VVVGGSHSQNPICELHDFLGHALAHFIHDQHKKQGGER